MEGLSPWTVYWITRMDGIHHFLNGTCAALGIMMILGAVIGGIALTEGWRPTPAVKRLRLAVPGTLALCGLISAFVPTTKELCAIIALPVIANSETTQELGSEVVNLAREWLEELHPKGKEE